MSKEGTDKTNRPPAPLHTFSSTDIGLRDQLQKQQTGNFHSSSLKDIANMVSQGMLPFHCYQVLSDTTRTMTDQGHSPGSGGPVNKTSLHPGGVQ